MHATDGASLTAFLSSRRGVLLARWAKSARVPAELAEGLLDALIAQLEGRAEPDGIVAILRRRIRSGAELAEIVEELFSVRHELTALWLADGGPREALDPLEAAIDRALVELAQVYPRLRLATLEALDQLGSGGRLEELLERLIAAFLGAGAGVDMLAVLLREDGALRVRSAVGAGTEGLLGFTVRVGEGFTGKVAANGRTLVVEDAASEPSVLFPAASRAQLKALLGVPLTSCETCEPIGVLLVGSRSKAQFSEEDRWLFHALARRATLLIDQTLLREQLEAERARLRALLENSPAIIFLKDREGRYLMMSRSIRMLGGEPEQFVGATNLGRFPRELSESFSGMDREVLATGTPVQREEQVRLAGGKTGCFYTTKFPIRDAQGAVYGLGAVAIDISDRKREELRRRVVARASEVLSGSLDYDETIAVIPGLFVPALAEGCAVAALDPSGAVRVRAAHGDPGKAWTLAALERSCTGKGPEALGALLTRRRAQLFAAITRAELALIADDPDRARLLEALEPSTLIVAPLFSRDRSVGGVVMWRSGVAEPFNEADRALAEQLAGRAALALDNARLYAEAQRAVRARDEMIEVVAHDLKNPLQVSMLAISSLSRSAAPNQRPVIQSLVSSTERMNRLTRDLLDVALLESGKLKLQPEPVSAERLARESVELIRPLAEQGGLTLTVEAAPGLPPVVADAERILQVLGNLLGNAVKFTPAGGSITVRARREGEAVVFGVEDSGPGVPTHDRPHLFDRFWRKARHDRTGAGLGLAICQGLVEGHHGKIWYQEREGGGSAFEFTLPVSGAPLAHPAEPVAHRSP